MREALHGFSCKRYGFELFFLVNFEAVFTIARVLIEPLNIFDYILLDEGVTEMKVKIFVVGEVFLLQ